jgi:hypothetical protein
MSFKMTRVNVFHAEVPDRPGGIALKLKACAEAGAHLEYVYSQRSAGKQGVGDLFVAPHHSTPAEASALKKAGMHEVNDPVVFRVEGDDKAGLSSRLAAAWEMAGINLHGMTLAALSGKFVGYVTFDTPADGNKAAQILAEIGSA